MKKFNNAVVWLTVIVMVALAIYSVNPDTRTIEHPNPGCRICQQMWQHKRDRVRFSGVEANIQEWSYKR